MTRRAQTKKAMFLWMDKGTRHSAWKRHGGKFPHEVKVVTLAVVTAEAESYSSRDDEVREYCSRSHVHIQETKSPLLH